MVGNVFLPSHFVHLVNRIIFHRNPPSPIIRLHLCHFQTDNNPLEASYIASLLDKASTFGLSHLTVDLNCYMWECILPSILSLSSLEFLQLKCLLFHKLDPSTPIYLNHLKILCFDLYRGSPNDFINRLVPQLDALEELKITSPCIGILDLKSMTLRKLRLELVMQNLRVSAPSLEVFEFKYVYPAYKALIQCKWDWEMPMLRKAIIQMHNLCEENVESISKMLNTIAHVRELHLDITEKWYERDIFHALLVPSVDQPTFMRLKYFHLEVCFHEFNIKDLVTIIQHSPALESLKLVHKPLVWIGKDKKKKFWRSMLPRNAEGNYRHAYYKDLHIAEKKDDLLRKLLKRGSSKRLKT